MNTVKGLLRVEMARTHSSKSRRSNCKTVSVLSSPQDPYGITGKHLKLCELSEPQVNIPGIDKIIDTRLHPNVRFVWIIAFIICSIACIYQVTDRVLNYLDYPVVMDVKIERNQTIIFPTMTMCSTFGDVNDDFVRVEFRNMVCSANRSLCRMNFEEMKRFPFAELNLTMDEVSRMFTIKFEAINTTVACPSRSEKYACSYTMKHESVFTYWGSCLVLTPESPLEYRGPYTYIRGRMNNVSAMFWLHAPGVVNRHAAYFLAEPLHKGRKLEIRLGAKQFEFQNRSEAPCTDARTAVECQNDCIDRNLEKILNCSLPYINTALKRCDNWEEVLAADAVVERFYTNMKQGDCVCQRICHETLYTVTLDIGEKTIDENVTNFRVYYPDNTHERATEMYSYRLPALLSDIGGTFGFYMGFSIFTFIEIVESAIRKVKSLFKPKTMLQS